MLILTMKPKRSITIDKHTVLTLQKLNRSDCSFTINGKWKSSACGKEFDIEVSGGRSVTIKPLSQSGQQLKVGFSADRSVEIVRNEVIQRNAANDANSQGVQNAS